MPTRLPPGLVLGAFLRREDPRDALITAGAARAANSIAALPAGTVVGTSSLRRKALLLARRPDLQVQPLRGNVDTRLRKLEEGQVQATLLAVAGLKRLGREHIGYPIAIEEMLPAVGQGAICVEHREGDATTAALLEAINHWPTAQCVLAEHALLSVLDGSCRTPIGGHAEIDGQRMRLRAVIAKPDGSAQHATERVGNVGDGIAMGSDAAEELKRRGGPDFFTA
jgi:hydroxymethylbilane synthase